MIGNAFFFATNYEELKNNLPKNSPIAAAVSAGVHEVGNGGAWQLANRLNARHVARRCGAIMVLLIIPIIKIVSSRDCRYTLPDARYPFRFNSYPLARFPLPVTRLAIWARFKTREERVLRKFSAIMRDFYYKHTYKYMRVCVHCLCVCVCVRANLLIALKSSLGIKNEYVN